MSKNGVRVLGFMSRGCVLVFPAHGPRPILAISANAADGRHGPIVHRATAHMLIRRGYIMSLAGSGGTEPSLPDGSRQADEVFVITEHGRAALEALWRRDTRRRVRAQVATPGERAQS